ncbi:hypothetical protein MRX96_000580 [Rhipicephalus microplus]
MSVASALRHAGATILALCIALIAAAHQFCKRRVATPGNGNVSTSVDDQRDLRYTLLDRANFAACLAAIIIFVIGIVCLLARAIDHMVRTRSSLDMGLRTKFGRRLGGKPKYYAGSYAARLPLIFGEPFDGRGASSGSSQRPVTAPERIGGRRQTPTQPRSGSGVVERGRSTWVSGRASLDGSVLIGAIILAAAGVTVFVLGAIESLSPHKRSRQPRRHVDARGW